MMLTKPDLDNLSDAINDSGASLDEIRDRLANGVTITYGDLSITIEAHAVERARDHVAGYDAVERRHVMHSVNRALSKNVPKVLAGKLSKRRCDNLADDLVLWHALKAAAAH